MKRQSYQTETERGREGRALSLSQLSGSASLMQQLTEEEIPVQEAAGSAVSPELAEDNLREMLPQDVVAMHLIDEGKKYMAEGDYEGAVEHFEQAVATSPSQPRGYYFLARVSFLQKQYRQALAFLEKAELLFGHSSEWQGEVHSLKGAIYEEVGDEARARLAYERALQFTPQNLSALSGLTRLHGERKERNELPSP
jgi:Flp pilus assembly protein TadD